MLSSVTTYDIQLFKVANSGFGDVWNYYCEECGEVVVDYDNPAVCPKCGELLVVKKEAIKCSSCDYEK